MRPYTQGLDAQMCTCLYLCLCYLKAKWVEAGVCLAANWAVSLNLHGIQQVLVAEAGGPADLELSCLNTAGTSIMELETVGGEGKKRYCDVFYLISRSQVMEAIIRLP